MSSPELPAETELTGPVRKGPGGLKSLMFSAVSLLTLAALIECGWRLLVALGLLFPPTSDRSLIQEWEWAYQHLGAEYDTFGETMFRFDPEIGWFPKAKLRGEEVNTNVHGQRGTLDWPVERTPDKQRILIIGDSYTFGFEVKDNESYPAQLNNLLPQAEVINWGVPGYGTDQQLLLYERDGVRFKPDVVVLGFYTRDLFRNDTWFRSFSKPVFEVVDGELALTHTEIISPTEMVRQYTTGERRFETKGLYLLEYARRMFEKLERRRVDETSPEWLVTSKIIERFARRARAEGSKPFLLILPHDEILEKEVSATSDTARLLTEKSVELGMPSLDLTPILRETARKDPRPLYKGHMTAWGNEVTARALLEALKKEGLVEGGS
ncbi:MAG: SGNH/GDSL hydrolase family protein [Candidatus Omnitrophica bacterium]|nr:SGNH/GDSL hydrolase family protein [Candidatus Omnitrophota bacterium]